MSMHPTLVDQWDVLCKLLKEGKTCNVDWGNTDRQESLDRFKDDLKDRWNRWDKNDIPFPTDTLQITPATDGPTKDGSYRSIIQVGVGMKNNLAAKVLLKKK